MSDVQQIMKLAIVVTLALVLSGNGDAAIVYPKAPDGGQAMVSEFSGHILRRKDPRFLGGFGLEELTIAEPYRIYDVGLTNLSSGHLLSAATTVLGRARPPGLWTYPLIHGTNAIGEARLTSDEKGKAVKAVALSQTDFSQETLEALRIAEKLPQVKKQDYEVRRLEVPSLSFLAVWLHGGSDDIIIPLPSTFDNKWNAYEPYSEGDMIKLLQPKAVTLREQLQQLSPDERRRIGN